MMRLTIIGFGNQAKSWALNLKDSGFPVVIALQPLSPSFEKAKALGFHTVEIGTPEFYREKAFALLTPDQTHKHFMKEMASGFSDGSYVLYAHGFSLLESKFNESYPNLNHILFAPKSIGSELRRQFELKGKLGAVYSLEHVHSNQLEIETWVFDLARSMGINMGPYKTNFERETKADLFSEQGLLCSLIPYTADLMFKNLVDSGVEKELAYFECWYELKLIINAMIDKGPMGFFDLISPNALIGSEKGFEKLMTPEFRKNMNNLLIDIESGEFNRELEKTNVDEVRQKIRDRWAKSELHATFEEIQQEQR